MSNGVIKMKKMIKRLRCQKGVAAVEFAIILSVLMMVILGIIEFGLLLYDKQVITNASREGARAGTLVVNPRLSDAGIQAVVNNYVANNLVTFSSTPTLPVTTIVRVLDGEGIPQNDFGDDLTVTVTYNYAFLALPNFVTSLAGVETLVATTVMRME
jgi:Flp pilus assembly protein TadG